MGEEPRVGSRKKNERGKEEREPIQLVDDFNARRADVDGPAPNNPLGLLSLVACLRPFRVNPVQVLYENLKVSRIIFQRRHLVDLLSDPFFLDYHVPLLSSVVTRAIHNSGARYNRKALY